MADHKHTVFVRQAGTPVQQDRCTIVLTGHYQEWEPSNTTHIRIAYDRLLAPEAQPLQTVVRVNPGKKVAVPLGACEPGKCEIILGHDVPKMFGNPNDSNQELLASAQAKNVIKVSNKDGVEIGLIYPNRGCLFHFSGEIFVESTHATALLKVSVFPA